MAELYAYITNFNSISSKILSISFICIILYTVINLIINFKNNKIKVKFNINNNITAIDIIGGLVLSALLVFLFLYLIKSGGIISYILIPSILYMIYVVYLRPILTLNDEPFIYSYSLYGFVLIMAIWINSQINYFNLFNDLNSESISQVMAIFLVLIQSYINFYCLFVNIYFLIKSFTNLNIRIVEKFILILKEYLEKNLSYNNIVLNYKFTNSLFYNKNIKKIFLLFIPYFIFDTFCCVLLFLSMYIYIVIINPIFLFIIFMFNILNKISITNENQINYWISKITLIISLIIAYLLIQLNNSIFQERIIATYEFLAATILVPIILESLLSFKEKIKSSLIKHTD